MGDQCNSGQDSAAIGRALDSRMPMQVFLVAVDNAPIEIELNAGRAHARLRERLEAGEGKAGRIINLEGGAHQSAVYVVETQSRIETRIVRTV